MASLVETCKLNGVDPQRYFADVLSRLVNGWPNSRIDELMPWRWAAEENGTTSSEGREGPYASLTLYQYAGADLIARVMSVEDGDTEGTVRELEPYPQPGQAASGSSVNRPMPPSRPPPHRRTGRTCWGRRCVDAGQEDEGSTSRLISAARAASQS